MSGRSFREQLDVANDEIEVRRRLAEGLYNQPHARIAEEWLLSKDQVRANAAAKRKEDREEKSLSISVNALRNSTWAVVISLVALIVVTLANHDKFATFFASLVPQ
jgi:hypothetical protein